MQETKKSVLVSYYGEEKCELKLDVKWSNDKSTRNKGILSISLPWDPEEIPGTGITARPPYGYKGENLANDKAWKQYNKAELVLQKNALRMAVQQGFLSVEDLESAKWSRTAYCSCGCSPSWVLKNSPRLSGWLTITSPKKEAQKKQEQAEEMSKRETASPTFSI